MTASYDRDRWVKMIADEPDPNIAARMQQTVDYTDRFDAGAPKVIPACPSWCMTGKPGHAYSDVEDDGTYNRYHLYNTASYFSIELKEHNHDGVVSLDLPLITTPDGKEVSVEFLRTEVASLLDLIVNFEQLQHQL